MEVAPPPRAAEAAASAPVADLPPAAPPEAAAEISLRVDAPDRDPVEVRVRESGGAIEVAVRATDAGTATTLRSELSELVDRLEQSGYQSDAWVPGPEGTEAAAGNAGADDTGRDPEPGRQAEQQGRDGRQQREDREQAEEQRQGRGRRLRWEEELAMNLDGQGRTR
ncbi:MAG: flagellar hook-length control protein FliK [Gemmatimonadota bacterium]|nr:flagellar hook-length control protein FliK [Gemmatimonadota bacterium]